MVHIVDIGFGGGDMLTYILKNKHLLSCPVKLTGVDLLPEAKSYAELYHPELKDNVTLITMDYRDYLKEKKNVDIIIAGLFCHHLTDEQNQEFFEYIQKYTKVGGLINDLHRHPLAYYSIKWLTKVFSKSKFTKNDAPLSVLRGFKKHEIINLLNKANVESFSVNWKWAFRYIIKIDGRIQ
jgi:cyclopropane fatty-acyl-phospholipid synthase-like methyltransferase